MWKIGVAVATLFVSNVADAQDRQSRGGAPDLIWFKCVGERIIAPKHEMKLMSSEDIFYLNKIEGTLYGYGESRNYFMNTTIEEENLEARFDVSDTTVRVTINRRTLRYQAYVRTPMTITHENKGSCQIIEDPSIVARKF